MGARGKAGANQISKRKLLWFRASGAQYLLIQTKVERKDRFAEKFLLTEGSSGLLCRGVKWDEVVYRGLRVRRLKTGKRTEHPSKKALAGRNFSLITSGPAIPDAG